MSGETTETRLCEMIARTSKLNGIGAHYFVGWLVSVGTRRPEMMAEIEAVLQKMETAAVLRQSPVQEPAAATANVATEIISPSDPPTAGTASDLNPLHGAVSAPESPLRSLPLPEATPAAHLPFAARLFASLFQRRRIAA